MNIIRNFTLVIVIILCSCKEINDSIIDYSNPNYTISFDLENGQNEYKDFLSLIDHIDIVKLETEKDYNDLTAEEVFSSFPDKYYDFYSHILA